MSVVSITGFDTGAISTETSASSIFLTGTSSISTTQARTGTRSLRCNPSSGAQGLVAVQGLSTATRFHFGIYIASMPSVSRMIFGPVGAFDVNVFLDSTGTLSAFEGATAKGTSSTTLSTGTWYWIGVRGNAGVGVDIVQIDGVSAITGTISTGSTTSGRDFGASGVEASAIDIYIDDIICDTANFLGPSKVGLMLPISDNTVTGVTDNNGVTTNIWQCVDNVPPAGVASANEAANPKVGMHFPASVTCNYLANLATYTTTGVGASDTVLAVQSIVRHGEDIVTGTKNLQNVTAVTNPTIAGSSVTAGNDAGAHGAETGLWATTFGTLTTSPSVTLGTSPTVRTSRVSESRVACVDFMAMYVAWTPAVVVVANPPYNNPMPPLLAQ